MMMIRSDKECHITVIYVFNIDHRITCIRRLLFNCCIFSKQIRMALIEFKKKTPGMSTSLYIKKAINQISASDIILTPKNPMATLPQFASERMAK